MLRGFNKVPITGETILTESQPGNCAKLDLAIHGV